MTEYSTATFRLYGHDPRRCRTVDAIIDSYLADQNDVVLGQFCAIATAGEIGRAHV